MNLKELEEEYSESNIARLSRSAMSFLYTKNNLFS